MMLYRCKSGETKSLEEWQRELDDFWNWAEKQNRRFFAGDETSDHFVRPADAFERYARVIELKPVGSYKGVF